MAKHLELLLKGAKPGTLGGRESLRLGQTSVKRTSAGKTSAKQTSTGRTSARASPHWGGPRCVSLNWKEGTWLEQSSSWGREPQKLARAC